MADKTRKKYRLSKIFKRAMALFIIVIINFNSYAAVVSSNDGSAFITKAEFDALVNDFNSRIEDYEKSIDAKIDGAIAEYLAGLVTNRTDFLNIIYSDWDDGVYNLNGDLDPTFVFPKTNLYYNVGMDFATTDWQYYKIWWGWLSVQYNGSFTGTQYRALVSNVTEYPTDISNAVWNGRALRWIESIRGVRGDEQYRRDPGVDATGVQAGRSAYIEIRSAINLGSNGYYSSPNAAQWNPQFYWYNASRSTNYSSYVVNKFFDYSHELNLEPYNGKTTDHNHIISWSDSTWSVWNKDWAKTIRTARDQTLTRKGLYDASTKAGDTSGMEIRMTPYTSENWVDITGGKKTAWQQRKPSVSQETSTTRLVTAGLVSDNMMSTQIKQAMSRTVKYAGKSYDLFLNLCQGFPICVAAKDERIVWSPVFSEIQCASSAATDIVSNGKINILLATQPFSARGTVDSQYIIKTKQMKEGTVTANYSTTPDNSLTMELDFTMPTDGIVYAIWWPTFNTSSNLNTVNWEVKLDITRCSTYMRESET